MALEASEKSLFDAWLLCMTPKCPAGNTGKGPTEVSSELNRRRTSPNVFLQSVLAFDKPGLTGSAIGQLSVQTLHGLVTFGAGWDEPGEPGLNTESPGRIHVGTSFVAMAPPCRRFPTRTGERSISSELTAVWPPLI
jgi:hypothetical protein